MKKAAIITFEFNYNYGAILQATAMSSFLKNCGYEVDIVNRGWGKLPPPHIHKYHNFRDIASDIIGKYYTLKSIKRFKSKNWILTPKLLSDEDIVKCLKEYDAIILGSDQIWNSACIPIQGLYYFGIHANPDKQKVIAYAPSFGKFRFNAESQEIETLTAHLRKLEAISVRETDGITLLKDVFGINDVPCVLDPTMLMTDDFYIKLAKIKRHYNKTLAYYILDMTVEKKKLIEAFAKLHGLLPVNMNLSERTNSKNPFVRLKSLKYPSVESWLEKIANASFVITDSYHGSVFSILFNKQFLAFGNTERGLSRFDTLMSKFNLEDRLITSSKIDMRYVKPIDYSRVNQIIKIERLKSVLFLKEALL